MFEYIHTNWLTITLGAWTVFQFLLNAVSNSLAAPTATSSDSYRFWFKFVNYCALNTGRAKNLSHIEDSPNFIPAAEAYHQEQLKKMSGGQGN